MKPPSRVSVCPECGGEKDSRAELCAVCRFDPEVRFWRNVEKTDTCWLWTGWMNEPDGYGRFRVRGIGRCLAHRFAYELLVGPIPPGLYIDHLCRVRRCVNPEHLEIVTHRENVLRGTSFAAGFAAQTHCKRGHEFTPGNTYIIPSSGSRQCLTCRRAARPGEVERRRLRRAGLL